MDSSGHLGRFVYEPSWTPLRGTYLWPLKFFGPERSHEPNDYLEVIKVVEVSGVDVAISRGGGLFVRDHGQLATREAILRLTDTFETNSRIERL